MKNYWNRVVDYNERRDVVAIRDRGDYFPMFGYAVIVFTVIAVILWIVQKVFALVKLIVTGIVSGLSYFATEILPVLLGLAIWGTLLFGIFWGGKELYHRYIE